MSGNHNDVEPFHRAEVMRRMSNVRHQKAYFSMLPAPAVTFIPDFLPSHKDLFDHLLFSVEWDERLRARKTASFGVSYNYSGITYPRIPMPESLQGICKLIEETTILTWREPTRKRKRGCIAAPPSSLSNGLLFPRSARHLLRQNRSCNRADGGRGLRVRQEARSDSGNASGSRFRFSRHLSIPTEMIDGASVDIVRRSP